MNNNFITLLVFLAGFAIYWIIYSFSRPKIEKNFFWKIIYVSNLFLAEALMVFLVSAFNYVSWSPLIVLDITILSSSALLHHLSVVAKRKRLFGLISPKMHGPISHFIFFSTFCINTLFISFYLLPQISNTYEKCLWLLFLVSTTGVSILGLKKSLELRKMLF